MLPKTRNSCTPTPDSTNLFLFSIILAMPTRILFDQSHSDILPLPKQMEWVDSNQKVLMQRAITWRRCRHTHLGLQNWHRLYHFWRCRIFDCRCQRCHVSIGALGIHLPNTSKNCCMQLAQSSNWYVSENWQCLKFYVCWPQSSNKIICSKNAPRHLISSTTPSSYTHCLWSCCLAAIHTFC